MKRTQSAFIVIPVYNPPDVFGSFVRRLRREVAVPLCIVNDGSHVGFDTVFASLSGLPDTTLLRHTVNKGKGAALKTAMRYIRTAGFSYDGIITVDADGQHETEDILHCMRQARQANNALLIGTRIPRRSMPIRSRLGNAATRIFLRLLHNKYVTDTQSGLRYVPARLMKLCEESIFDTYDFELDMIIRAVQAHIPLSEFPMRPIYINKNKSSHFKTAKDSWLVSKVFFHHLRKSVIFSPNLQ